MTLGGVEANIFPPKISSSFCSFPSDSLVLPISSNDRIFDPMTTVTKLNPSTDSIFQKKVMICSMVIFTKHIKEGLMFV